MSLMIAFFTLGTPPSGRVGRWDRQMNRPSIDYETGSGNTTATGPPGSAGRARLAGSNGWFDQGIGPPAEPRRAQPPVITIANYCRTGRDSWGKIEPPGRWGKASGTREGAGDPLRIRRGTRTGAARPDQ